MDTSMADAVSKIISEWERRREVLNVQPEYRAKFMAKAADRLSELSPSRLSANDEGGGIAFDARPHIGATTPEPCLREIIRAYYRGTFSAAVSDDLTNKYIAALSTKPESQPETDWGPDVGAEVLPAYLNGGMTPYDKLKDIVSRNPDDFAEPYPTPASGDQMEESPYPWKSAKFVPGTSVARPSVMLMDSEGACIGVVGTMNAECSTQVEVARALSTAGDIARTRRHLQAARKGEEENGLRAEAAQKALGERDAEIERLRDAAKAGLRAPGAAEARIAELKKALDIAIKTGSMLLQNSEGCAVNHYGDDFQIHGLPGWLCDCRADLEESAKALRSEGAQS